MKYAFLWGLALPVFLPQPIAMAADTPQEVDTVADMFLQAKRPSIFTRYRLALVDQDGIANHATASTLLTKLRFQTAQLNGFSVYAELDSTLALGAENYNNTLNGKTDYPVVADPQSLDVNQLYLLYKNDSGLWAKAGRQMITIDHLRFIGNAAWRQNDRTYDAVGAGYKKGALDASYYYIWNENRVVGGDSPVGDFQTSTHVMNAKYTVSPLLTAQVSGYLVNLNTDFSAVNQSRSSQTYTAKISGTKSFSHFDLGYNAEYGTQSDYATSLVDYSVNYQVYEISAKYQNWQVMINQEILGSDNGISLQTPFGNLHKHNGYADKFLSGTPTEGLKDNSITLSYTLPGAAGALKGTSLRLVAHDFKSEMGDIDYGSELDFVVSKKLNSGVSLNVKGAFYSANQFATDTSKLWFFVTATF